MQQTRKNDIWLLILTYMILLTVIITVACSCSPQRKLASLEQKHPELLLQYCASKVITDTIIIPGGVQIDTQMVWLRCDTVTNTDTLKWTVWKKVPIYYHSNDTVQIIRIDTSGKALLRSENSRLTDEKNTLQGKISTWQFLAILGYILAIIEAVIIGIFIKWK